MKDRKKGQRKTKNYHSKINFRKGNKNIYRKDKKVNFGNKKGKNFYKFNRKHGPKLTNEKLDDDLANYFKKKDEQNFKNYLDNDIENYINQGKINNENSKENKVIPPNDTNIKKVKIEPIKKIEDSNKDPDKEKEKHNIKISIKLKG